MPIDTWTKTCLTLIAIALLVIAFRPSFPVAHAAEEMRCTIDGPLEIKSFGDELEVKVNAAFSSPGSSASAPMYVHVERN